MTSPTLPNRAYVEITRHRPVPRGPTPKPGNIWLFLCRPPDADGAFYLDIPVRIITRLCQHPRKYLRYLGWCVLGIEGQVTRRGEDIGDGGVLADQGIYDYVCALADGTDVLARAIDPEVIKLRSNVSYSDSALSEGRVGFRAELDKRDKRCVFTQDPFPEAAHIIPYARGDEWFRLIIAGRNAYEEDVSNLISINDIRNGLFVGADIHRHIDARRFVILKTPNRILDIGDVPPYNGSDFPLDAMELEYPLGARFSLQCLDDDPPLISKANKDACFLRGTLSKPSSLILHYNYGAAVVKLWGCHAHLLSKRNNIPRPEVQVDHQLSGPSRMVHDRNIAIQKRVHDGNGGGTAPGGVTEGAEVDMVETMEPLVGYKGWDEDDWMLFLWSKTPAGCKYFCAAEEEFTSRVTEWVDEVPHDAGV
ncbi:uncharacterized protein EI90DRAFT_3159633 [Cantharellus anzutake]|uniref:uncharacterized protein n=1 Tax=Cantharellus anzutake TaxID=1750568 RepID=UPI001904F2BE|nr:uncharacterized protein EI90DRAFT_3159633 [Cantharellus anzutake]KAF8313720.1 hypothetical protein EI90DRAFT_3159633 [Cantharellus anzutake]